MMNQARRLPRTSSIRSREMRRKVAHLILGAACYLDDLGRFLLPKDNHPATLTNAEIDRRNT